MNEEWVREHLPIDGEEIILAITPFGGQHRVSIAQFVAMFADCEPTYAGLCERDLQMRGGYRQYFDGWHEQGILR